MTITATRPLRLTPDDAKILSQYAGGDSSAEICTATGFSLARVGRVLDEHAGNNRDLARQVVLDYAERTQTAAPGVSAPPQPGPAAAAAVVEDSVATLAAMDIPPASAPVATEPIATEPIAVEPAATEPDELVDVEPVDAIGELLDRAEATEVPKLQRAAGKVRDLIDELRAQLFEHTRETRLRAEQAELEQRLAVVREQLRPRRQQQPTSAPATTADVDVQPAVDSKKVRAWAAKQPRLDCSAHGRIPAAVLTAYREAHQ
jgi:hypothetical protein